MKLIAQKLLTLIAVLSVSVNALAYDFEVDGIYYNILSAQDKTVEVTYKEYSNDTYKSDYSGDVVIPEQVQYNEELYRVTSIGNCAFYYCSSLASVTIPEGVTSIGDYAFDGCSSLASVTIPEGVTSIGDRAFDGCSSLASVTIPEGVTSIGNSAFYGCSSLASVTIPEGVTSIGYGAFRSCSSLASVTIPESVTSIGNGAFWGCSSLASVTIPEGVTSIGDSAFSDCSSLTSVNISDLSAWCRIDFEGYGANPLDYAHNLYLNGVLVTDLVIPEDVSEIKSYAFSGCSSLASVTIPNSVTSIGGEAFYGCSSLASVTIPNSVTSIGGGAFWNCSSLTSVTIPESVTSIGNSAFGGCSSLTSVTIPESVTSIGNGAFHDCSSLTSVTIPESVTSIGDYAFDGCSSLTSVTIPESVTSIGNSAFYSCRSLKELRISNLSSYLKIKFEDDDSYPNRWSIYSIDVIVDGEKLTDLVIPEGISDIGDFWFRGWNLNSVTIPEGVKTIGDYAFYCYGIKEMLVLPSSIESIGSHAFETIAFPICRIEAQTPPSIVSDSFLGLSVLIVPNGCSGAYKTAYGDTGLKIVEDKTVEVTVPLESNVFDELIALRATPSLITDLTVHGSLKADELSWINSNMTSLLNLDISDTDCTTIPDGAFQSNGTLMGIKLPQSLQSIGNDAFNGCRALWGSITLPETVETVGDYAFQNCPLLEEILFSGSLARIGDYAFNGCSRLQSAYIPDSIEEIGRYAFSGCNSLAELSLPDGLTSINDGCFENCGITQLKFPSALVSIGNYAFNSSALEIVDLSGCLELKEIKDRAFISCSSLKTVNLPASLERIGTEAFSDCKALAHISSPCVTPPAIEANANPFNNVDNTECLLSIPTESFRDYFISAYWAGFMAFEEKAEIQIEVENRNERSNGGGCAIKYRKGGKDSAQKARTVAGYAEGQTEQDGFSAVTNGGSSVFVTGSETADFEIKPDAGMKIEQILYDGEDVTGQLSGNVYSVPAVAAYDVKNLTIILSSDGLSGAEEISTESSIQVYSSGSSIIVKGSDVENVEVYNLSGQLVYGGTETTINVPAKGIYIVRVAGQTFKVAL